MPEQSHTHVIKIGDQGSLTLYMPEMAGRHVVIEQCGDQVTIRPMSVQAMPSDGTIIDYEGTTALLGPAGDNIPRV